MPDRNWEEQIFREEYARESAREKFRADLQRRITGKKKDSLFGKLKPFLLPGCLLASLVAVLYYFGGIVGISWHSFSDWQFVVVILILTVLGAVFYFKS